MPHATQLIASQVITASGNSGTFNTNPALPVNIEVEVTAVSGTTPSMTLSLQWSDDNVNWAASSPPDAFSAITAATNVAAQFPAVALYWRLVWTVTGTTPSFTLSVYQY